VFPLLLVHFVKTNTTSLIKVPVIPTPPLNIIDWKCGAISLFVVEPIQKRHCCINYWLRGNTCRLNPKEVLLNCAT
jgi:hypothetical protein